MAELCAECDYDVTSYETMATMPPMNYIGVWYNNVIIIIMLRLTEIYNIITHVGS